MPDKKRYDAGTIDWPRIRAYAKRVAGETTKPKKSTISYTTNEFQTVTEQEEITHGLFNMSTWIENRSEQVAVNRRVDVVGSHTLATWNPVSGLRENSTGVTPDTGVATNRSTYLEEADMADSVECAYCGQKKSERVNKCPHCGNG